jgi:hypothetical protein
MQLMHRVIFIFNNAGAQVTMLGIAHQQAPALQKPTNTATDLSTDKVVALLAIPAVLDSWRFFGKNSPNWLSWTSRGFMGVGVAAIWRF